MSSESGTPEVYVAPVRQPGDKRPISVGGGTTPRWRKDGQELYYASAGNRSIMAVPIQPGPTVKAGIPTRLFSLGTELATRPNPQNTAYDVTPDGKRFLVSVPAGEPLSSRITVVQNWSGATEKRSDLEFGIRNSEFAHSGSVHVAVRDPDAIRKRRTTEPTRFVTVRQRHAVETDSPRRNVPFLLPRSSRTRRSGEIEMRA